MSFVKLRVILVVCRCKKCNIKLYVCIALFFCKVEKILEDSLDSILSPSPSVKIMDGEICLRCRGKTLLGVVKKLFKKVCWHTPEMFYLITLNKLYRQYFEFSLKVKVMGLNSGNLIKSLLLQAHYSEAALDISNLFVIW